MTSFQSLLSSIGGGQPKAPQPKASGASNAASGTPGSTRPQVPSSGARPTPNNMAAGVKRKPDEQSSPSQPKTVRTEVKVPVRPVLQTRTSLTAKPASPGMAPSTAYRGTARPSGLTSSTHPARPAPKAVARPAPATTSTATPAASSTAKPKRGFAAIMEKAKAAEEAAKAAGSSLIKHKPVDKVSKRERERERERAQAAAAKSGAKGEKPAALLHRSRSGTPNDGKPGQQKKALEIGYKGTMKKAPAKPLPVSSYTGTMRKSDPRDQAAKPGKEKGMAQDKYGGYASWSDLSGAEDDEEEQYDSDGSSLMEAGLDDVEFEETQALRAAKREDQEALEEEERLRREKAERRKRLQALNNSAATKRKY